MRHTVRRLLAAAALVVGARAETAAQGAAPCTPRPTPPADTTALPAAVDASGKAVTIVIEPGSVVIGGCTFRRNLYSVNGAAPSYLPPTLRIQPGAALDLTVVNRMSQTVDTIYHSTRTNFHFHGFSVTPGTGKGSTNQGDQVVNVSYVTGEQHRYAFSLPPDHPMGMHWYHPHPHGFTDEQVGGGMSGAILVGDVRTRLPNDPSIPEKVLLFKDFQPNGANAFGGAVFTINGDWPARFTIPTGTRQLWHVGHVGSDALMGIKLVNRTDGSVLPFIVIGQDGNPLFSPMPADSLLLDPATRYEVVVEAPNVSGAVYDLVNTGSSTAVNGKNGDVLGTLTTVGPARSRYMTRLVVTPPRDAIDRRDQLLAATNVGARTFTFSTTDDNTGRNGFLIDRQFYDPRRLDVMVEKGKIEDWTLVNADDAKSRFPSPHVFHIHQGDFLLTKRNGQAMAPVSFQDRLTIDGGDALTVRIPFTDAFQVGLYVFHCHILFHEDNGMMKNVCVYPSGLSDQDARNFCQSQLPPSHAGH